MDGKYCPGCKKTKRVASFWKNKAHADGLNSYCSECSGIQNRKYWYSNPEKNKERAKKYRAGHRKELGKRNRKYYQEHKEWWARWREKNPDRFKATNKKYRDKLRLEVIHAYGGECKCCGQDEVRFLTIEHVNHDGKKHRAEVGKSTAIYRDLKRRGFPKRGYTLLCWDCQMATRFGEPCPHKMKGTGNECR